VSLELAKTKMVKFIGTFHSTLEFGQVIIVGGTIKKSAENFTLNLLSENASDIPFHMNFVFGENSQIIRNTKINGEFGAAENFPGMFTKEKNPLRSGKNYVTFHRLIKILSTLVLQISSISEKKII
jgi:hypothetical protein